MSFRICLLAAGLLLSAGPALASSHGSSPSPPPEPKKDASNNPGRTAETKRGRVLVDGKGMTLYTFAKDETGDKSNCDGPCAQKWQPFVAPADAKPDGDFTLITRSDGTKMWAYRYRPLYTWHEDKAPGEVSGEDIVTKLWRPARPE